MRTRLGLTLLTSILTLASCGGGGGGGGSNEPPTLAGTLLFVPETIPFTSVTNTPALGEAGERIALASAERRRLQGELVGGRDLLRLRTQERVEVTARLVAQGRASIAHQDPVSLAVGQAASELRFLARGPVDVIVHGEDGAYTLELATRPVETARLEGALGTFLVGDRLALTAATGGQAELSCAQALELVVRSSVGLVVLDAEGKSLARIAPEGGEARIEAATLQRLVLVANGDGRVELEAQPTALVRPLARVADAEAERVAFGLDAQAALAGEVSAEFVPGELLVRVREESKVAPEIASRGGLLAQRIPETSELVALQVEESLDVVEARRTTLAAIAAFEASPDVEFAEPNYIRRALGGGPVTPNDPFYQYQWHYPLMKLPEAWSITTGDPNMIVAVVDTGSRSHPDLNANTISGFDFVSDPANAGDGGGIDADATDVGDGTALNPSSFHGTHVAGTIGAVSNNASGVAGVCWSVSLMHIRVLGKQGGTDADIAQGLRYAARLSNSSNTLPAAKARVINMSLGGPGSSNTMQATITAVRNAGCVIIAAAGNNNSSQLFFPASYTGVISVSAVDLNAQKAPYSNFGTMVDVAAPGGDVSRDLNGDGYSDGVLSTLVDENNAFAPNFVFYQGTSMASPHVAGLAALILSVNPALTVSEVETILTTTTIDLGAAGRDDIFGHGLVQADRALQAAGNTTPPTPVIAASPTNLVFGTATTQLTVLVSNAGGGALDVGTPAFNGASNFVTGLQTVPATGATDVSAVIVTVDRTGLSDGDYTGTIQIPSNGGTAQIAVSMTVATPVPPVNVDLFVLLVDLNDPQGPTAIAQAIANPTTSLDWQMLDDGFGIAIPAGDYVILCGSDDDNDGFVFGTGDVYTGGWPTLNELVEFPLSNGDAFTGLDFPVTPSTTALVPPRLRNIRLKSTVAVD
ncbi:MAG: S8 family peptidase [Planctomycetota bacterium]|nr:S8 family peptidase [Planctomycetota bacterium]